MPRFYFDAAMRKLVESHAFMEGLLAIDNIQVPGASTGAITERSSNVIFDHLLLATNVVSRPTLIDIGKLGLPEIFKDINSIPDIDAPMTEFSKEILKENVSQILDAIPRRNSNYGLIGISASKPQEVSEVEFQTIAKLALDVVCENDMDYIKGCQFIAKMVHERQCELSPSAFAFVPIVVEMVEHALFDLNFGVPWAQANGLMYCSRFDLKPILGRKDYGKEAISIVTCDFREVIGVLPSPANFREALDLRESKPIKRLREKLDEWIEACQTNQGNMFAVIESDIAKAQREVERMRNIEKFKKSNLYFFLISIGGHIPILSNIMTVAGSIEHLWGRLNAHRFGWFHGFRN